MFSGTNMTFYAQAATVERLQELTRKTGLSRSAVINLLVERAEVEPVTRFDVRPVKLPATQSQQ